MIELKIYEQADHGKIGEFRYHWILSTIGQYGFNRAGGLRKWKAALPEWQFVPGAGCRGAFVTRDRAAAIELAARLGSKVETNGTHEIIGAPGDLILIEKICRPTIDAGACNR